MFSCEVFTLSGESFDWSWSRFDHRRLLLISFSLVLDSRLTTGVVLSPASSAANTIVCGRRRNEARTGVLNLGPAAQLPGDSVESAAGRARSSSPATCGELAAAAVWSAAASPQPWLYKLRASVPNLILNPSLRLTMLSRLPLTFCLAAGVVPVLPL